MLFSKRVDSIKPSPTLAITAKAAALRAEGKDIIGLGAGEPDFETPEHIRQAGIDAINQGLTRYTPVAGILPLREAIVKKLKRDNGLLYTTEQIVVSVGAKQGLFNAIQALIQSGDEVIIPAPYWVSYPDMTLLADGVPVIVSTKMEDNFKLTPDKLEAAITNRTKLIILNSPSNPTGIAYKKEELQAIGDILSKYPDIVVITDDIYEHILWDENKPFCNILMACPDLYDRTIIINGVSKAYAMTGWRIGYAAGSIEIIKRMSKIQGQSTSNATSIAQVAAQAALDGDQSCISEMLVSFKERHDFVVNKLNSIPHIECLSGDGTFYALPNVEKLIDKIDDVNNDADLAEKLITDAQIAVVPGSAFGAPGHIRISFATSKDMLDKALTRLHDFVNQYA